MIDFTPSKNDQAAFDRARASALICRKYARYYDENEHEMAPETLPETEAFMASHPEIPPPGPEDSSYPTRLSRLSMIHYWGDYTVRKVTEMIGQGTQIVDGVLADECNAVLAEWDAKQGR